MEDVGRDTESVPAEDAATTGTPSWLIGHFYAWWQGDPLPALPSLSGLAIAPGGVAPQVATVTGIGLQEASERMDRGHRPWVARIGDEAVGWGWVAGREAEIAELGIALTLPSGNRYLWDFTTRPAWRGRGVYPALLQAILRHEGALRCWIGHDEGNDASARGIARAGFRRVGSVHRTRDGHLAFVPEGPTDRASAAAGLLGLPMVSCDEVRSWASRRT